MCTSSQNKLCISILLDTENLNTYPQIFETILNRKWVKLNNLVGEANISIMLEFFANTNGSPINYTYYAWGKFIYFSLKVINNLLGKKASIQCVVKQRRILRNMYDDDELGRFLTKLCREGGVWVHRPNMNLIRLTIENLDPTLREYIQLLWFHFEESVCTLNRSKGRRDKCCDTDCW